MDDDPLEAPINKLTRAVLTSEGWAVLQRLKGVSLSYAVFNENYEELRLILEGFEREDVAVLLLNDRPSLDNYLVETTRRLHNYVASASTFIDHQRRMLQSNYGGHPLYGEYRSEVLRRFMEPLPRFVQDLRNFAVHREQPPIAAHVFQRDATSPAEYSLRLDLEALKAWTRWKPESKTFLSTQRRTVDLTDVVEQYHTQVVEFHEWLSSRVKDVHAQEFAELNRMQDELAVEWRSLQSELGKQGI